VGPAAGLNFFGEEKNLAFAGNRTTIPRMSGVLRSNCNSLATAALSADAVRKPVDYVSVLIAL